MNSADFTIRPADDGDVPGIIRLIDGAAEWLSGRGTRQWAEPWPNAAERENRIRAGIALSRKGADGRRQAITWIVTDDKKRPVATTFITRVPDRALWTADELEVKAVYLHRLVIDRGYAGAQLGDRLVQWAGEWGRRAWGAEVMRIDVWADNVALHEYYLKHDFRYLDEVRRRTDGTERPDPRLPMHVYPSGVVLVRPLTRLDPWPYALGFTPGDGWAPRRPVA